MFQMDATLTGCFMGGLGQECSNLSLPSIGIPSSPKATERTRSRHERIVSVETFSGASCIIPMLQHLLEYGRADKGTNSSTAATTSHR